MTDTFLTTLLPQLASGAAHTHALGFGYEGLDGDRVRIGGQAVTVLRGELLA